MKRQIEGNRKNTDGHMALLTDMAAQAVVDLNTAHRNGWVKPNGDINRRMFSSRKTSKARAYELSRTGESKNKMSSLSIGCIESAKTLVRSDVFREILNYTGVDWTDSGIEKIIDRS